MFKSLDALVRSTVIAATLCTSSVVYADNPPHNGAYYIDPAKRRKKEERKAAVAPPKDPANQPAKEPLPEYVQPAPPVQEQKSGKGVATLGLVVGLLVTGAGVALETMPCTYATTGGCTSRKNHAAIYTIIGSGAVITGISVWYLLK
ncbi:MAG TPA: hypothetical protein VJI32_06000 [Candidatus Nanoarchaeia archaeon]|nr:hypothetical protein [Candidatus Nanoarchaeia archaeon]